MFLTRSKTSSALSEEQLGNEMRNNAFSTIPTELISVLEEAIPAMDSALKPVLCETGHKLVLNMISTWIVSSRMVDNNLKMNNKTKHMSFRSWATRSFPIKSKATVVAPATQLKLEISDNKLCHQRIPSFTDSASSTSSFSITSVGDQQNLDYRHDASPSLYTPLLHDSEDAPTSANMDTASRIPVSIRSMIDLLETPPLIASDDKSLSLIDETITPLSSTFFHDNDHIQQKQSKNEPVESPTSTTAPTFTTASENESRVATTVSFKDTKNMRRSVSNMFMQIGSSVKKAFKKKSQPSSVSSVTGMKKAFSIQESLSLIQTFTKNSQLSYSSLEQVEKVKEETVPPDERPEAKAYAAAFASFLTTNKVDKSLANIYGGKSSGSRSSSVYEKSDVTRNEDCDGNQDFQPSIESNTLQKRQNCWEGEDTQSQQFDKLLDDIWEQSQEYQGYFAAEKEQFKNGSITSFGTDFNGHLKNTLWSPVAEQSKQHKTIKSSKTEGNMNALEDSVPFVCVGKQRTQDLDGESIVSHKRKSQQVQKKMNIEDMKTYKRSTSAYSNIRDYDLNWQESFHLEQKSRDKVSKTLKSISWGFYSIIKRNHNLNQFDCDSIFDENESSVSDELLYSHCSEPLTEWNDIYDQLAYVFDCGELTSEHAIITFIYVKRMLDLSKQKLWDFSWRLIIMSSLLTAVKVWDDCAIFNADFAMIFPELTVDVINNIERVFLTHLEWDVSVNCSEFAKTYFQLRDIEHMMDQW